MRDYRVLELWPDGRVVGRFDISARDDDDAKKQALQAASSPHLELWRHDRKISEWRGQWPNWQKIRQLSSRRVS